MKRKQSKNDKIPCSRRSPAGCPVESLLWNQYNDPEFRKYCRDKSENLTSQGKTSRERGVLILRANVLIPQQELYL